MRVLSLTVITVVAWSCTLSWHAACAFSPSVPFASSSSLYYDKQQTARLHRQYAEAPNYPWETPLDMVEEETLLKINLALVVGPSNDDDDNDDDTVAALGEQALAKVQQYTQAFPFAAVLPVQPLQYLPTQEGGVDVLFMRKKTAEKGSIDGGMRFFVSRNGNGGGGVEVEVKRNSKGQTISKAFTERLVVQAYCEGIAGKDDERTGKAPLEFVSVSSIFHKWL
mmetsp:Transcript_5473/g.9017  ORF Transcript_5473/g.9017 Transcript_5473/m.9017 type:complete len:224 (-) Transcript_5473:46-717(-)|eukprot:CAMPEP_0119013586 /NCGR_PEP_ID=MMETSP1176-20130426/8532_1 /TAXON_ID=265551 /ORGANISM="Synedropsis recta cf, Strain CCMP1620" /LENGTH=223 /DNA_ID=CAMNT_0006966687 /DNA_START=17 /DNA_END=688 /DNA_ORIENTATION=+